MILKIVLRRKMLKRILIIDDEEAIRSLLRLTLERAGYEVEDAPDGGIGLQLHRKNPADLIITDILMPEKEGIETIIELRRKYPDVKIIAISGGGRLKTPEIFLTMAEKFGVNRSLAKPVSREALLATVKELIGESEN
jgi:DNA-binding response OmpR family regulator